MDDIKMIKYLGYKIFYKYYLGSRLVRKLRVIKTPFGIKLAVVSYGAMGRTLLNHGVWEPSTTMFLMKELKTGNVFIDIGANIGYYTCLAATKIRNEGVVVAFEPEPIMYRILKLNINLNKLDNVLCEPYAVDLQDGISLLFINPVETGSHSLIPKVTGMKAIKVKTVTLDSYFSSQRLPLPDFVKIDVEGAEFRVLLGMKRIIKNVPNIKIIVELTFKEYKLEHLLSFLKMYDLKPYAILSNGDVKFVKYEVLGNLKDNNILLIKG